MKWSRSQVVLKLISSGAYAFFLAGGLLGFVSALRQAEFNPIQYAISIGFIGLSLWAIRDQWRIKGIKS